MIRPLGRGGMGAVYLGHDTMLDRPVALKFIAAAAPSPKARERFLTEARAIARLQHPDVVGIFRIGEVAGNPYLAYEFVSGLSLHAMPKPLSWSAALAAGVGMARGLAAAHRRGVLHRDIKPANIIMAESGEVKLLDFGLAKLVDAPEEAPPAPPADGAVRERDAALTSAGTIAGTPMYMAPELWHGQAASPQSDLYALGLVLYELLAGELPHAQLSGAALAEAAMRRELPPLATRRPEAPAAFLEVIDRCLAREPGERQRSADEVRDALETMSSYYQPFVEPGAARGADDDAERVAQSFARVVSASPDGFARRFYERLFQPAPELRHLFPDDMSSLRLKLVGKLQVVMRHLRSPTDLVPLLEDLGRRHAGYGAQPQHFSHVAEALLGALAEHEGAAWTPSLERAWTFAYTRIAHTMVRGLDEVRRGAASTVGPVPAPTHWEVPLKPPRTRRVQSGDVTIACQVVGDGPVDLVLVPGVVGHVERAWQEPRLAAFLRQLASFSRLVLFDPRGGGLSDRPARAPSLDERMADLRAVLDAVGCERAALLAVSEACAPALLFAATFPERTRAVILHGPRPRPDGAPPFAVATPGLAGDASLASWWSTAALAPAAATLDARELAPLVVAPALVLHRRGDRVAPLADGEALAAALGARLVALDGEEHLPFLGDRARVLDEVQRFVSAAPAPARGSGGRALGTLLAVTAPGGTIDGAARHEVAREVARRRGQELDREHHGAVLARFDSAGAAVACALALCASRPELAAGLGAGACRVDGSELDGPAAAAAALARRAAPGEVLATKLVRDLAAASGVDAAPRGDAFALRAPA